MSAEELKSGDEVEVSKVWAATETGTLRDWFSGYAFVRFEGEVAVVRHTTGFCLGLEVNYPRRSVRKKPP